MTPHSKNVTNATKKYMVKVAVFSRLRLHIVPKCEITWKWLIWWKTKNNSFGYTITHES